jgi:ElaB/YqjD/DUF883 family membrane-anchored ribosome-binding protein
VRLRARRQVPLLAAEQVRLLVKESNTTNKLKITMETPKSFSETKSDLNDLKKTATDASRDLGSTAAVHAEKAKGQASDLVRHFQEEAPAQLSQVRASFEDVVKSSLEYVSARPATSMMVVLGLGLFIGFLSRTSSSRD